MRGNDLQQEAMFSYLSPELVAQSCSVTLRLFCCAAKSRGI